MSEKLNQKEEASAEELERYNAWMADHPEEIIAPENRVECAPAITEIETLFEDFEKKHDLSALHAIIKLTPKEAPDNQTREPARIALEAIVFKLNFLKEQTNITKEKLEELKGGYKKLSQAVGIINNNIVDHTR